MARAKKPTKSAKKVWYVTATDKFMSGWGPAKGKINKLVIECSSYDKAVSMEGILKRRSEMKYVNITSNKPRYDPRRYYVSAKRLVSCDVQNDRFNAREINW